MAVTGSLMFFPEAVRYYNSSAFRIKLALLTLLGLNALVFHLTIYRDASQWELGSVPVRARLAGLFSLLLWIGVIAAGRSIPYGRNYDLGFNRLRCGFQPRWISREPYRVASFLTWLSAAMSGSVPAIRIAEIVHLFGLALFGGSTLLLNLSLFGVGPPRRSIPRIAGELMPWMLTGFVIMVVSGSLLFLSSPERFLAKPRFAGKTGGYWRRL